MTSLNITVLSSDCGGHANVSKSVANAIKNKYSDAEVTIDKIADEIFPGGKKGLDFHVQCTRKGQFPVIQTLSELGSEVMALDEKTAEKTFQTWLKAMDKKPDLIVSVVPLINSPLLMAAKEYGIPILVVTADGDNALYANNWPTEVDAEDLPPYYYAVPYSCLEVAETINTNIPIKNRKAVGYAVNEKFNKVYSESEIQQFKSELNLPREKDNVLIMMGTFGSDANYNYVSNIIEGYSSKKIVSPAHYNVFCGRDETMAKRLHDLLLANGFKETEIKGQYQNEKTGASFSVLGFTTDVHKYMASARFIISKPGSGSFNEALGQNLPILFDDTVGHLPWEGTNIDMAENYGFGQRISNYSQVPSMIEKMLTKDGCEKYRNACLKFKSDRPKQFHFEENVVHLAEKLLNKAQAAGEQKNPPITTRRISPVKFTQTISRILKVAFIIIFLPFILLGRIIREKKRQADQLQLTEQNSARQKWLRQGAKPIEWVFSATTKKPIDALMLKSNSEKSNGDAVIFTQTDSYESISAKQIDEAREKGLDVIIFNPTGKDSEMDLGVMMSAWQKKHPHNNITWVSDGNVEKALKQPETLQPLHAHKPSRPPARELQPAY